MKINYRVNRTAVTDEMGCEHISFGISAFEHNTDSPICAVHDLFLDEAKAVRLAGLCTSLELAPEQLDDVAADFASAV